MKISYLHDGSLVVEYPFNMAITLETSPHPLLSTDQPLHIKRKIILPDNMVHKLEWRYYLRRERTPDNRKLVRKIGRRMRVGNTDVHAGSRLRAFGDSSPLHASSGYDGKVLMVGLTCQLVPTMTAPVIITFVKYSYHNVCLVLLTNHVNAGL